jgi:hypothetical protein
VMMAERDQRVYFNLPLLASGVLFQVIMESRTEGNANEVYGLSSDNSP